MSIDTRLTAAGVELQVLLWRGGLAWPLAALVGLFAVALHFAVFVPARTALVAGHTELAQATLNTSKPNHLPATEEQQLEALRATLRTDAEPADLIRKLGELARTEQIALSQGEYQQKFHSKAQLLQVQVSQPVKTSYPQLRRYIEAVLRTMPNASLDQIQARRDNVAQAQLEVRLRWSFWLHDPNARHHGGKQ